MEQIEWIDCALELDTAYATLDANNMKITAKKSRVQLYSMRFLLPLVEKTN